MRGIEVTGTVLVSKADLVLVLGAEGDCGPENRPKRYGLQRVTLERLSMSIQIAKDME
jgi:hypothetical protein